LPDVETRAAKGQSNSQLNGNRSNLAVFWVTTARGYTCRHDIKTCTRDGSSTLEAEVRSLNAAGARPKDFCNYRAAAARAHAIGSF